MKKLLFLVGLILCSLVGFAQLPVSTMSENKNVVLEEFTGIYCVFCPDGHLRANQLAASNPGDVVLINIHTGSFAAPSGSDPDFRTQWGTAIASQSNLTGYPAGSINRREFAGFSQNSAGGSAQGRGNWATTATTVLGESSYANIALEGDIDYATNTLTVDVETYFTGPAPGPTVKLNVAVLQSNIEGPQTGSTANPSQVKPNGNYVHNHMLRHLLTGQWGVDVSTTMSTVGSYQYTWSIPADINGVPISLGDLEVVAFLSETQEDIVTGAVGPVTFTLPPGVNTADLEAQNTMSAIADYCQTTFTPEFTIKNNESFAVDSAMATAELNGTPITQWVTNIPANGTKVVTFPSQNLNVGVNTLSYSASVNGVFKYIDLSAGNDKVSAADINIISPSVNNFPTAADYESIPLGGVPTDVILEDNSGRLFVVDQNITNPPLPNKIGGYAQSDKSLRFDFASIDPNVVSSIITEKIDMSGAPNGEVQFDIAYAVRGTFTGDQFSAYLSHNCGASWVRIYQETGGSGLETAPPTAGNARFYPQSAGDWKTVSASIASANGAEIILKFEGVSAGSNALYFDNLMVDGQPIGISEFKTFESKVYPNPARDFMFVEMPEISDFSIEITNSVGQTVSSLDYTNVSKAEVNTSDLPQGVYLVNIKSEKGTSSKKITITK